MKHFGRALGAWCIIYFLSFHFSLSCFYFTHADVMFILLKKYVWMVSNGMMGYWLQ